MQSNHPTSRGARKGFTLIEVLVVVVIVGILAVIATAQFRESIDRAHNSGSMSNARTIQLGMESWKTDFNSLPNELIGANPSVALAADSQADTGNWPTAYTPGSVLPRSPWSNASQFTMDPDYNNSTAAVLAQDLLAGRVDADSMMASGFGNDGGGANGTGTLPDPAVGPTQRSDYGYVYYVGDPGSDVYYIFSTGKSDSDCLLVAIKSND